MVPEAKLEPTRNALAIKIKKCRKRRLQIIVQNKILHRDIKVNEEEEGTFKIGTELNDTIIQQILDANIHSLQISVTNSINKAPNILLTKINHKNNRTL